MKLTLELPDVSACDVEQCAYNVENTCHARAITVGDKIHPACDAFFPAQRHVKARATHAGVGACSVIVCRYNVDYQCDATAIRVGVHKDHADCLTFEARLSEAI